MNLDPTYKFFTEAGIVVLVLFLLCLLVGGALYITYRLIQFNEKALASKSEARDAQEKAKQSEMELEEIRLKMLSELTIQISSLTQRIADDREHDRSIREKEVVAVEKLVNTMDENNLLFGAYKTDSEAFRANLSKQSIEILREVQRANNAITNLTDGFTTVKEGLKALETAMSDLPKQVQQLLSPYCERMERALAKLETMTVED